MNWERELNIIRGKNLVDATTKEDIFLLFKYIDMLEMKLDESDADDTFGSKGWRYHFGV